MDVPQAPCAFYSLRSKDFISVMSAKSAMAALGAGSWS